MDTSLAEEVQQTMATLAPNRFFFMSPYRSFTTSGCFARFDEPAVNGDSPDSPFQQKLAALFADAKAQSIKNPVIVGAIPFDPRQPSSLYIPAGAGIVPASSPLGEWRETGVKLSTMLNVFGLH